MTTPLRTAIVGCGPMARWHGRALVGAEDFELVALCDLSEAHARALADEIGGAVYEGFEALLATEQPEVLVIVTPTDSHARLTIQAAETGVRGVYCEKPMATSLGDGIAMVEACRQRGVALAVNHQRRMSPPIRRMQALLDSGVIGTPEVYRGSCAGDLLSDATHLVDTIRFLNHDAAVRWAFGQIHRVIGPEIARNPRSVQLASAGVRYGHLVETGAAGVFELETGVRAELLCGDLRLQQRAYGDYEVLGTEGRLWRPGDGAEPALLIQDGSGGWRPVEGLEVRDGHAETADACYGQFARMVRDGAEHPLNGDSALRDLEIIMAIFESARLRARIDLPLTQMAFPLEIMAAERR